MITISVDPVLAYVGPISLRWYGLIVAAAMAAAIFVALREGLRRGVAEDEIYSLAFWTILSGIVVARLINVAGDWDSYRYSLRSILAFQPDSLTLTGGMAGGVLAGFAYCRLHELPGSRVADVAAPALLTAHAVGRIACLINGSAWGLPTLLPWGIVYTNPGATIPSQLLGVPTQPAAAYEIVWDLIAFGILWRMRSRACQGGTAFLTGLVLYFVGQFFITFLRRDGTVFAGLQQPQLPAIVIALLGLAVLYRMSRGASGSLSPETDANADIDSPHTLH